VFELQHFHREYGILSPENHRQIRGEAACFLMPWS
jgi:hypothetical protein